MYKSLNVSNFTIIITEARIGIELRHSAYISGAENALSPMNQAYEQECLSSLQIVV